MALLASNRLSVKSENIELLTELSFELCAAELVVIVGPNGAGKSTLLNAISGQPPAHNALKQTGNLEFNGSAMASWPAIARARQVAVLPQSSNLQFPFLVEEVVAMGRMPHTTGAKIDKTIVEEAAARSDALAFFGREYTSLSGGEKQRVQLARVYAQIWQTKESLLLLDEPLAALDIKHQIAVMQSAKDFVASGVSVVLVLHDIAMAARYADKLLMLRNGKIHSFGKTEEVLTESALFELYDIRMKLQRDTDNSSPIVFVADEAACV